MAVPAVLLHPEDRIDPEALLDRQALVDQQVLMVLEAPFVLEVRAVPVRLWSQAHLDRKPLAPPP